MFSVRYTPQSVLDINSVWEGVYEVSKEYEIADQYVAELLEVIKQKKEFPKSGIPLLYKGLFTGFYSVNYKKYKIFYRVNETHIEIIRVLMMKMDYMSILFGEE